MSRLASIVARDADWRRHAACFGRDPRTFFEADLAPVARRICSACPVRDDCLDEAIAESSEGFWGGMTDAERATETERRQRDAARPKRRPPRPAGHHYDLLAQLLDHPGRWALLDRYPAPNSGPAVASLLRNGHKPSPPGRWSFEARPDASTGGSVLYARYDGPTLRAVDAL